MAKRGIKNCPNCQKELGARTLLCSCGYSFTFKEVRPELLLEKEKVIKEKKVKVVTPKEPKYYTEPGQGRKSCPTCSVIISAVTKTCPKCSFDFSAEKKKRDEEKRLQAEEKQRIRDEKKPHKVVEVKEEEKEEISSVQRILQKEADKRVDKEFITPIMANMTGKEHAQRILSYGKERAAFLLDQHKFGNTWSHVDWKEVEAGLGVK